MNARNVAAASGARSIDCNWVIIRRVTKVFRPDDAKDANARTDAFFAKTLMTGK